MAQLRRRFRFAKEAGTDVGAIRQIGREELDRHRTLETAVAGAIHDPHATAPDLVLELVVRGEDPGELRAKRIVAQCVLARRVVRPVWQTVGDGHASDRHTTIETLPGWRESMSAEYAI